MSINLYRRFQVVVIGSGPAGARAAYILAQNSIQTAILEKSSLPRKKICAGGITGRGMMHLPEGLSSIIEQECIAVDLFIHDISRSFPSRSTKPMITMVQRSRLDYALTCKSLEAGASLFDQTCVRRLTPLPDRVELITDNGIFSADFVILADGACSPLAKSIDWPDHRKLVPAIEVEIESKKEYPNARFDFGFCKKGYAWTFPKKNFLSIGMLSMDKKSIRSDFKKYLSYLGLNNQIGSLKGHPIPMSPRKAPFIRQRILIVGDSAGFVDPVTGEGISYALKSGILAAKSIISGSMDPEQISTIYEEKIKREILCELKIGSILSAFLYGPSWIRRTAFRAFGPSLCRAMCSVINGNKTYYEIFTSPRNYLQLLSPLNNKSQVDSKEISLQKKVI